VHRQEQHGRRGIPHSARGAWVHARGGGGTCGRAHKDRGRKSADVARGLARYHPHSWDPTATPASVNTVALVAAQVAQLSSASTHCTATLGMHRVLLRRWDHRPGHTVFRGPDPDGSTTLQYDRAAGRGRDREGRGKMRGK
jgi:hypothetical protein